MAANFVINQWNHGKKKNAIELYSTHNDGKSVVAVKFIKTLKNKIDKYMTSPWKKVYIGRLDNIVNKCNNTYHRTINMVPADIYPNIYFEFNKENNKEGSKFKSGNHVRISKYKNIFAKGYVPNWSKEVFVIERVKNTVP